MEVQSGQLIDHTYSVETPEGIQMRAELAGVVPRAAAFILDFLIRLIFLVFISLIGAFLGEVGGGLILITWFLIEWGYPVFFEVLRGGQTPGKRKMDLVVMNDDLTPVTWGTSALRNLLRAVDMLPIGYLFGAASMVFSKNFQRLGDLVAGTLVLHKVKQKNSSGLPDVDVLIPDFNLSQEDRRALVAYVQRYDTMTHARAEELGDILTSVTGKSGKENIQHLYGIGKWLLGAKG